MSISYSIRKWAVANKRVAQGLIVITTLLLFFLSHILGVLAEMLAWDVYAMFLIGTGAAILAWTLAPRKGEDFPIRYTYARQKVAIVIMLISMCVGIGGWAVCLERFDVQTSISASNQPTKAAIGPKLSSQPRAVYQMDNLLANWFHGGISKSTTKHARSLAKKLVPKKKSVAGLILATIGCLILAFVLMTLVVVLSCSISCGGNQALGTVVLLGGLALVIFGLVLSLRAIYRNPNKKKTKQVKPPPDS